LGIIALAVPVALGWLGAFQTLGAHPWWALKVGLIGAPIGIILGAGLSRLALLPGVIVGLILLALCYGTAYYGKTQFAASYAADAFAGKLWYFGWIGTAAGLSALILAALIPRQTRKNNAPNGATEDPC
jgi:hypothetical protein